MRSPYPGWIMIKPSAEARQKALEGIRYLLEYLGEDPDREGLQQTPERVLKAWEQDWGAGYRCDDPEALIKLFQEQQPWAYDQMVIVSGMRLDSHCEHHMAPFFGEVAVAYLPGPNGIIGLSKMARVVKLFSQRLSVQERITEQVADFLETRLAEDVGVSISATHMCMCSRGVFQQNAFTVTTALRGKFRDPDVKSEFFARIRK